ncbi:histidine kinase [Candidatus Moduliflexus flocculans]|uniref:histidine kinase n=1 Tax=Candidatus Moduliflexus flocculans TaxID=1499966 RepID=A0A0S6VR75_9BACT|nr:histidine kinase [Candidatus Moduliflexus flocculans]
MLLQLSNICLYYGQIRALHQINLRLRPGEVHAIVGEHGAGKSSLGLILNGILKPTDGTITFDGKMSKGLSISGALKAGIRMIYQQVRLYDDFSVAQNLFLTNPIINRFAWNSKRRFLDAARELLERCDFDIDPAIPLKNLNLSDQTVVEFLKHLHHRPKLLILDEALERLSSPSLNKIVNLLKQAARDGMAILLITYRIDDIYALADTVSVIKNGEILITDEVKHVDKLNLIKMAYTQLSAEEDIEDANQEFSRLLKYNEAILRHLPVNLIVTDHANRIKMVNDYCKRYFGLSSASYFNLPLADVLSSANEEAQELFQGADSLREERFWYQTPVTINRIITISNIKTFPIFDGAAFIGNIIILEDMTEHDRLQKQVLLSEKLASVGLLAAGVAHEINNPLEIIYNDLSYLKYNVQGEQLQKTVDDIQEEIGAIATIISNLHSFSGNTRDSAEELDINVVIQNILNLLQHHARHQQIAIQFAPSEQELFVKANRHEIKQVLLNLFKNSFEAMPTGGDIFVETASIERGGAAMVQIRFRDTGPGINDENPDNIFLPFYSTKKGTEQNFGLGLSVSYGIIKKYDGSMTVENATGGGCQFIILLPQIA